MLLGALEYRPDRPLTRCSEGGGSTPAGPLQCWRAHSCLRAHRKGLEKAKITELNHRKGYDEASRGPSPLRCLTLRVKVVAGAVLR